MAAHVISTVLRFVRKHISSLCCLLLLLLPPVHRVLLFFSPLLVSTALCVLALISWGPSSDGQNKNIKMDEWAAVRCDSELECNEACSNADNLEEISRSQELAEEQPDNSRERLQEGKTVATSVKRASKPAEARTSEPDPDLKNHDDEGSVEEGSVGVHPSIELSLYLRHAPLQKRSEEEGLVIPASGCDKRTLQSGDAKLLKAVEKELAGLEASLWSYEGAMEERPLGSLGDVAMEDGAPKHHLQGKSVVRKEKVLHEQRKAVLHAYEPSGLREVALKA